MNNPDMSNEVQVPASPIGEEASPLSFCFSNEMMIRHFRFRKGAITVVLQWNVRIQDNSQEHLQICANASFCSPNDTWSKRRGVKEARILKGKEIRIGMNLPQVRGQPWTKGRIERRINDLLPTLLPLFPQWHRWVGEMQRAGVNLRGEMQQAGMMKWVATAIMGAMGALALTNSGAVKEERV